MADLFTVELLLCIAVKGELELPKPAVPEGPPVIVDDEPMPIPIPRIRGGALGKRSAAEYGNDDLFIADVDVTIGMIWPPQRVSF